MFHGSYGDIRSLWTSPLRASPISRPPTLAIACKARQLKSSLWSVRSFLMLLTTRCNNSCCSWRKRVIARYPICFSEYCFADIRLTASRWPKSTFHPSIYIYKSYSQSAETRKMRERSNLADVFLFMVSTLIAICMPRG